MPAISHNTIIEQGSSYSINFLYTDTNNQPIDISQCCVVLQWKTNLGTIYTFSNKNDTLDYSMISQTNGNINLTIPAKTTNSYTFDSAIYDLIIQEPNEEYAGSGLKTYRLATGTVFISKKNIDSTLVDCADINSGFVINNNCNIECDKLDIYSIQYEGSGIIIQDNTINTSTINTSDTRNIENIEVVINGLNHNSPQDLIFILQCPGDRYVLLSGNSKIKNYKPGFSFMFSNRATAGSYISNILSGQLCLIKDKTDLIKYADKTLLSSFDTLVSGSLVGDWNLIILDTDDGTSGFIDSWKLIITYDQP